MVKESSTTDRIAQLTMENGATINFMGEVFFITNILKISTPLTTTKSFLMLSSTGQDTRVHIE